MMLPCSNLSTTTLQLSMWSLMQIMHRWSMMWLCPFKTTSISTKKAKGNISSPWSSSSFHPDGFLWHSSWPDNANLRTGISRWCFDCCWLGFREFLKLSCTVIMPCSISVTMIALELKECHDWKQRHFYCLTILFIIALSPIGELIQSEAWFEVVVIENEEMTAMVKWGSWWFLLLMDTDWGTTASMKHWHGRCWKGIIVRK